MPIIEREMSPAEKRRARIADENERPLPTWMWDRAATGDHEPSDYVRLWRQRTAAPADAVPDADDMAEAGIYVSDDDPRGILPE